MALIRRGLRCPSNVLVSYKCHCAGIIKRQNLHDEEIFVVYGNLLYSNFLWPPIGTDILPPPFCPPIVGWTSGHQRITRTPPGKCVAHRPPFFLEAQAAHCNVSSTNLTTVHWQHTQPRLLRPTITPTKMASPSPPPTKRAKLDAPSHKATPQRELELAVGIAGYVHPDLPGWQGVFKKRYADFLVNEIGLDEKVAHLTDFGSEFLRKKREKKKEQKVEEAESSVSSIVGNVADKTDKAGGEDIGPEVLAATLRAQLRLTN